jgi:hypothetical protein
MVMTIGELHAGHCIDPSLADAVKRRNEIRCVERLRTRGRQARPQPNRSDNTPSQGNFRLHPTCRDGKRISLSDRSSQRISHASTSSAARTALPTYGRHDAYLRESTVEFALGGPSGLLTTGSRSRSPDQQVT